MNDKQKNAIREFTNKVSLLLAAHADLINDIATSAPPNVDDRVSRSLALSKTKIEEARMWANDARAWGDF